MRPRGAVAFLNKHFVKKSMHDCLKAASLRTKQTCHLVAQIRKNGDPRGKAFAMLSKVSDFEFALRILTRR
jgi:hypothetical protein